MFKCKLLWSIQASAVRVNDWDPKAKPPEPLRLNRYADYVIEETGLYLFFRI